MIRKAISTVLTILALATVALWVVGHYRPLWATFDDNERGTGLRLHSSFGKLGVETWALGRHLPRSAHGEPGSRYVFHLSGLGFHFSQKETLEKALFSKHMHCSSLTFVMFPHWFVYLSFATYPVIAFIRGPLRRYRRRKRGWCIHCGYDLTGNVTGVCSECGKPI